MKRLMRVQVKMSRISRPPRIPLVFGLAATLAAIAGCVDDEVRALGAQNPSAADTVLPSAPSIAPEDTATRTVAEAIARSTEIRAEASRDSMAAALEEAARTAASRAMAGDSAVTRIDTGLVRPRELEPVPAPEPEPAPSYRTAENPDLAARMGWPVAAPEPLPGAIIPEKRIIAYYGNPLSTRMGALGQYEPEEMLRRLDAEVAAWNAADPLTPAIPALHLIAVIAQADAGSTGKYRAIVRDELVERVAEWADSRDALVFLDIQVGLSDIREILPHLEEFLARPNFHLGIDPEFAMRNGARPGTVVGTYDASDINYVTATLARIVQENDLPPKVLVVHRFTRNMVTNTPDILLRPEVQIVMHMDGWGGAWLKRDSYEAYVVREPVHFAGIKVFYKHDSSREGWAIMTPQEILKLHPVPYYVQYQ
jgi:hypothetical protein